MAASPYLDLAHAYWEQAVHLWWEHTPVPQIALLALLMLAPLVLLRWGKLDKFLEPTQWKPLPLAERRVLNHNTRLFRFKLPYGTTPLGLPLGRHILIKGTLEDGSTLIKPYTPVSSLLQRGHVDFVIKVYPEGRMSQTLDKLRVGDTMLFKGPKGEFELDVNEKRALGMVAGGTGITPMLQVAAALLQDPLEHTTISLVYANVSEDDILLRREIDQLSQTYSRFKAYYVLNEPPPGWQGGAGFVSKQVLRERLPPPADDVLVLRCGPPAMNKAMRAHLVDLGYAPDQLFEF